MQKDAYNRTKHLFLIACFTFALPGMATAANDNRTLLMLDYSRSMWSQIDGLARYQTMRNVIGETLPAYENNLKLGLIGYGYKSPASCGNHVLLQTPAMLKTSAFNAKLKKLKPNGRAPLTRALITAAKTLGDTSRADHVILITDGFDNCSGDPCAQASKIHNANPELKIHVIAFGASDADAGKLACLTQQTGGKFLTATDKPSLERAVKATFALAAKPFVVPQPPTTPAPDVPDPTAEAPTPALTNTHELKLSAVIDPVPLPRHGPRLLAAIKFSALHAVPVPRDPPRGRVMIAEPINPGPAVAAPIMTGSIKRNTLVQTTPVVQALARNPHEDVVEKYQVKTKPNPYADSIVKPSFFITPKDGGGKQGIALKAQISASLKTIKRDVHWSVYKIDDAAENKWRKVAEISAPTAKFNLQKGDYVVRSGFGHANAAIMVSVEPGKISDATIVFNAGGLRIKPSLAFLDTPKDKTPTLSLVRLGTSKGKEVMMDIVAEKILRLNAGTYELTSKFGTVNAISKTQIIIKPGLLTDVEINHKAAIVNFKLANKAGGKAIAPTSWQLLNMKGILLKKSKTLSPSHILAPGKYKITAVHGTKAFTSTFSVSVGETKLVELLAQ